VRRELDEERRFLKMVGILAKDAPSMGREGASDPTRREFFYSKRRKGS